jgi:hypothetical protein
MDLAKLSQHEKLAAAGGAMLVVGGLIAAVTYRTYGLAWIGIFAGLAMLAVVLQPQLAPAMKLPGSRGSLMLVAGGAGAVVMLLALLTTLDFTFFRFGVADFFYLVAVAGGVLAGFGAWRAFQAEGGTFQIGGAPAATAAEQPAPEEAAAAGRPVEQPPADQSSQTDPDS